MDQFEPVRRCRSGGELLGLLDEGKGGEQDKGVSVEFSCYHISASEISTSWKCKTEALIRIRQFGLFEHSLEERVSFATVLVIHSSSFDEL